MRTIIQRTRYYQCEICETKYKDKSQAQKCEQRKLENREFKNGDRVTSVEPRHCYINKPYNFRGVVVKVIGPMPSDYDYECRHLGGKGQRLYSHVFQYEVEYICPVCLEVKRARYYGPEIKKITSRQK